jgi:hypothetical protein
MSRLLNSPNTLEFRNNLVARNLYTPLNPYDIDNPDLVNTINTIADIINPGNAFDITNTILGRVLEIGPQTPIAQIGTQQLLKQFQQTLASFGRTEVVPVIDFDLRNIGRGKSPIDVRFKDFSITVEDGGFLTKAQRFVQNVSGIQSLNNPFRSTRKVTNVDRNKQAPTNEFIVQNTGKGSLAFTIDNINSNQYKVSRNTFITAIEDKGLELSDVSTYVNNRIYFPIDQANFPFANDSSISIRQSEILAIEQNDNQAQEYGYSSELYNRQYVERLGKVKSNKIINDDQQVVPNDTGFFGFRNTVQNQLVWGRDGITQDAENEKRFLEFVDEAGDNLQSKFGVRKGLLYYTNELLNASGAKFVDQTKKVFRNSSKSGGKNEASGNDDSIVGFNGNALYRPPDDSIITQQRAGSPDLINNSTIGIRQHNVLDQYDRFAKTIRYEGAIVYGAAGSENSTIGERVIPKFTPELDGEGFNIRNMMFSMENLAISTIRDEQVGVAYMDDPFGTELPIYEGGDFGGRLMWFAPYDIRLSEQAIARHESTVFIGRGEPIYTYNNSERIATLSFKLIIDYPPQLKSDNFRTHKSVANFFAFGANENFNQKINLNQKVQERANLENQLSNIKPLVRTIDPQINPVNFSFYFINNEPGNLLPANAAGIEGTISRGYEDGDPDVLSTAAEVSELTPDDQGSDSGLNVEFIQAFEDGSAVNTTLRSLIETYPEFIEIQVDAHTSALAPRDFNQALSERRIAAITDYLKREFPEIELNNIPINTRPLGETFSTFETSTPESIHTPPAKEQRRVDISIRRNDRVVEEQLTELTPQQQEDVNAIQREIDQLTSQINEERAKRINKGFNSNFLPPEIVDRQYEGFEPIVRKKFRPVFYSQTPEDFHRRLTFLQQCTRQGSAVRQRGEDGQVSSRNSVFGRQPIVILRIGDMFNTKVIVEQINFDYTDAPWDLNPEGMGMQYMAADIDMTVRIIGGQSLQAPIDALQNAASFNYYANSTFYNRDVYRASSAVEAEQVRVNTEGAESPNREELRQLRNNASNGTSNTQIINNIRNRINDPVTDS